MAISLNRNMCTMLILLMLLVYNVNSISDDTSTNITEQPLQECTFNITLTDIANPITQYCPNRRKRKQNNKKDDKQNENNETNKKDSKDKKSSDSLNDNSKDETNTEKRRKKFVKTCINYTITGEMTHSSEHMSIFLPLCPQSSRNGMTNIQVSDVSDLITNDTFKNGSNVKQALGYLYNDTLGILVQLIDETAAAFELCVQNIKQKNDKSLDIEKIGTSEGIVWMNSTNKITECTVHGLPCFKFKFKKTCGRTKLIGYKYNITDSPDDIIQEENELLTDDKDNDKMRLNNILGVSKESMWTIIVVLIVFMGFIIAYLVYICKRKKSNVYHFAVVDENEVVMEDDGDSSDSEGENSECIFTTITTK